mgnify:CR=1 FL=1
MFDLSDNSKKMFLQEILQYWILSVKDSKWKAERERRYVIFEYYGSNVPLFRRNGYRQSGTMIP